MRGVPLRLAVCCVALCPISASAPVDAASTYQVIEGGQCIPYPGYQSGSSYSGINWQHFLYGFRDMAFCHLTMTDVWPLSALSYVLFTGWTQPNQVLTARLCVHAFDLAVTCGASATISGGVYQVNLVFPPSPLPPDADGAFVQFNFPTDSVSGITEVLPVWSN
jgi:hypothetical protein